MTAAFSWFWDSEGWGLEPTIAPYPIGTKFSFFGQSGYVVTGAIASGKSWEYTAEFHGPIGLMHWRQDTYSHNHIVAIDAISNPI